MKIRIVALGLALCLLLSGCTGWMDGSYSSAKPHTERQNQSGDESIVVSDYTQLLDALAALVEGGGEALLINVAQMEQEKVRNNMERAIAEILALHPIGAYAVEAISYDQGTSGGQPALAVEVTYNQNWGELRCLREVETMKDVEDQIANALGGCESKVVMRVRRYQTMDCEQFVRDYMLENPQTVMEMPQVTVNTYPETGTDLVLEIYFTYQTDRDDLQSMQNQVEPLFTSAELYVGGHNTDYEKYTLLYAFLMERHDYSIETSITPAYSLLVHGVGNSRAFATVFAAMCRRANLECRVVSGTKNGTPWFWNLVWVDGTYHHLDLVECWLAGLFDLMGDREMEGYVWDYSAYPRGREYMDPWEVTEPPTEPPTEPTDPWTDPTEPPMPPTEPTEPPTEPTEPPTEPTEPPTEPTEPPTEPTEPPTEPTEPPTEPTEPPTEPPSEPTEPPTEPTETPTEPTEATTEPTEPSADPTDITEEPTGERTNSRQA